MARKKDMTVLDVDENGNVIVPPPRQTAPDTDAHRKTEETFWRMLGEDEEGTGYVNVHYLANGQNRSETLVLNSPADQYDYTELLSVVQKEYAPRLHPGTSGLYRIRLYVKNENGQHVCRGNKLETILAGEAPKNNLPAVVQPGTDPALAAILGQLAQGQQQLATAIADLSRPRESAALALLKETAPLWMPAVATGLVEYIKAPKKSASDLTMLKEALALTGTIRDMRADADGGGEEPTSPWAGVIMKVLDNASAYMQTAALRAPARPLPPAAPTAPGATPPPVAGGDPQHPLYAQIVNLLDVARDGADPEETAAALWEKLPEAIRPQLVAFLNRPEAMRDLVAIHPGVMDHLVWTDEFRLSLVDIGTGNVQDSGQVIEGAATHAGGSDHATGNT